MDSMVPKFNLDETYDVTPSIPSKPAGHTETIKTKHSPGVVTYAPKDGPIPVPSERSEKFLTKKPLKPDKESKYSLNNPPQGKIIFENYLKIF